ncbi:DUF6036 family nucleotidyltransferase [Evansella tamaricis]|uniref:DUF6036 family nucleotidyltransferase n=1 Tax=Evansella tamaricis TaxID=2069301 RepID=UPI00362E219B
MRKQRIALTIFGGSALLLKTDLHVTGDIDAVIRMEKEDVELRKLLRKYNINDDLKSVMELPPMEDVYEDMETLNVPFNNIKVELPSPELLIISKLFATRQTTKDMEDVLNSGILDHADINKLKMLYKEYRGYTVLPERRYNSLDDLLEDWENRKKKGR